MALREAAVFGEVTIAGSDDKGGTIKQFREYSFSWTPAGVATITAAEQTTTVTGLKVGKDAVICVEPPSDVAGVAAVAARVSANDTLAVKFVNPTAGTVTPASGTWKIRVIRTA